MNTHQNLKELIRRTVKATLSEEFLQPKKEKMESFSPRMSALKRLKKETGASYYDFLEDISEILDTRFHEKAGETLFELLEKTIEEMPEDQFIWVFRELKHKYAYSKTDEGL